LRFRDVQLESESQKEESNRTNKHENRLKS
jgi:hypothetical protein